ANRAEHDVALSLELGDLRRVVDESAVAHASERPSSGSRAGFHATSHKCPSGSVKYPATPPQNVSCGSLTMAAPAFRASSITSRTSARLPTLCARLTDGVPAVLT